jgi:uncharacterized RDD family membrane protein YckC
MRRSDHGTENETGEPRLFDLPLDLPGRPSRPGRQESEQAPEEVLEEAPRPRRNAAERVARAPRPTPESLPFVAATPPPPRPVPAPAEPAPVPRSPDRPGAKARFAAGAADLLVHAAVLIAALVGCRLLDVRPALAEWAPLALFVLSFSFLYTVVPLAFWGQTLGMSWAGLVSRNADGEPLTFDQTARRWLAGLATAALLGLPLLLPFGGRVLSDWASGSRTYEDRSSR